MKTCDMSSKDRRALCPRTNCSRHPQPSTTSDYNMYMYVQRSKHTHAHTHARTSSPSCTCAGTCTSLWFPERLLGSQSPAFPLNAAGPETRAVKKQTAQRTTHATQGLHRWAVGHKMATNIMVNSQPPNWRGKCSKIPCTRTDSGKRTLRAPILCKIPFVF